MNIFTRKILRKVNSIKRNNINSTLLKNRIKLLKTHHITTLLDVGANTGQFAYYTRHAGYRNRIVSFEPLSEAFSILKSFAASDPKWDIVNCAMGNKEEEIEINVSENLQSSSFLDMMPGHVKSAPDSAYVKKEKVKIYRLDDVIGDYTDDLSHTFLKIDTQGYEKNVLEGAAVSLKEMRGLQLELSLVELYKGETLFREMLNYILDQGFTLCSLEPGFTDSQSGQLLQVDAIFYRLG
ncbi:MAG: FkbM family methyltransferase [Bacteroidales bacterium]